MTLIEIMSQRRKEYEVHRTSQHNQGNLNNSSNCNNIFTNAQNNLSKQRGVIGANQSRVGIAINNLMSTKENFAAAESRIRDADIAADAANLVNEAALLAARRNKPAVTQEDFEQSTEKVMMGPERKSRVVSDKDKKTTAVHEAGHALVAILTPDSDPVHKISIIPRGYGIAGYTLQRPDEDNRDYSRGKILNRIKVLLGGRIAEKIYFNEITAGASNDLQRATQLAHAMVCEWGMSDRLGNLAYGSKSQSEVFMGRDFGRGKDYSEQTAQMIDEEIRNIVDGCYKETYALMEKNKPLLDKLSARVLEKETLDEDEIRLICGLPSLHPVEPLTDKNSSDSAPPFSNISSSAPSTQPLSGNISSEPPPAPPFSPAPSF